MDGAAEDKLDCTSQGPIHGHRVGRPHCWLECTDSAEGTQQ